MTVPARLSIVTLGVADLDRAGAFYASLGWERCASSNEEITWYRTADSFLGLFPYDKLAADADISDPSRGTFGGITLAINVESEDAVIEAIASAVAAGASLLKEPKRADWGGFSGYFTDPDGYPWEVAHNPHFPIDEHGRSHIP